MIIVEIIVEIKASCNRSWSLAPHDKTGPGICTSSKFITPISSHSAVQLPLDCNPYNECAHVNHYWIHHHYYQSIVHKIHAILSLCLKWSCIRIWKTKRSKGTSIMHCRNLNPGQYMVSYCALKCVLILLYTFSSVIVQMREGIKY